MRIFWGIYKWNIYKHTKNNPAAPLSSNWWKVVLRRQEFLDGAGSHFASHVFLHHFIHQWFYGWNSWNAAKTTRPSQSPVGAEPTQGWSHRWILGLKATHGRVSTNVWTAPLNCSAKAARARRKIVTEHAVPTGNYFDFWKIHCWNKRLTSAVYPNETNLIG